MATICITRKMAIVCPSVSLIGVYVCGFHSSSPHFRKEVSLKLYYNSEQTFVFYKILSSSKVKANHKDIKALKTLLTFGRNIPYLF